MKSTRSTHYVSMAFYSLGLTLVIILLSLPILTKEITKLSGDSLQPEKLDINPIPVHPPFFTTNEIFVSITSSPPAMERVPHPVPIPAPRQFTNPIESLPIDSPVAKGITFLTTGKPLTYHR